MVDNRSKSANVAVAPVRRTQAERRETTREKCFQAAIEIIAEAGYERASIAEIGKRAGYSRAIVTHTFGSKSGLLEQLIDHILHRWSINSLKPAVGEMVGLDALMIALDEVLLQVQKNRSEALAFYQLQFDSLGPLPELRPQMMRLHQQMRRDIASWITSGINAGKIVKTVDPESYAALYLSVIRGAVYQWMLDPEIFDIATALAAYKGLLAESLRVK